MDATQFLDAAERTLERMLEQLEAADTQQLLELDHDAEGLRVELEDGRVLIVSIHRSAQQIWLASPRSGGLHFSPTPQLDDWQLSDGRSLGAVLSDDLSALTGQHWTLV
jgi:iron donor protein CyaY